MPRIETVKKAHLVVLSLGLLVVGSCGVGGQSGGERASDTTTPVEETAARAQAPGGTTQGQRPNVFTGEHENLKMGDTADWRMGFHLRLSNPHRVLGPPDPKQKRPRYSGTPGVVMQVEVWNDGEETVPLKSNLCSARDENGFPLKMTSAVREVYKSGPPVYSTPLEPGQERSSPQAYELPQSGATMTFECSLAYGTGDMNILMEPEPPKEATVAYTLELSSLP